MMKRKKKQLPERPLDPSRNIEDFMGDTTGRTGITRGTSEQTSAEPEDVAKDTSTFRGGTIKNPKNRQPTGVDEGSYNDRKYNEGVLGGMSSRRAKQNEEDASEPEKE